MSFRCDNDETAFVKSYHGPPNKEDKEIFSANVDKMTKAKACCRKGFRIFFSHIGLFFLVCLYSVIGGYVFQYLEAGNEKKECISRENMYILVENSTLYKLWAIYQQELDEYNTLLSLQKVLQSFRDQSVTINYDGTECTMMGQSGGNQYEWSWAGAMYFAVTVITTIGYGHIAPKTYWGRMVCIAYAVIGIPLMLLFLANIGDVMADLFKFVYAKVCCCGCFKSLTNKGGDKVDQRNTTADPSNAWRTDSSGNPQPPAKAPPAVIEDESDDEEDEFDDENITIPLTITMMVIALFIVIGALLFGLWEGWDMMVASYFCFVTISTIGFGDFTPGTDVSNPTTQIQLICGAIYMIFGMAILSMCFSLIQDEIAAKFKWLGQKLGLVEKENTESEQAAEP